ncbi:MAG: GNAT family N-acetyltransferase [Chloroflexota bacterium]
MENQPPVTGMTIRPATMREIEAMGLDYLQDRPGFQPSMLRVGVYKDRVISRVLLERLTLRYGSVYLRAAGLGSMETTYRYRGRGYSAALIRDVLATMREQGAHLALLNDTSGGYFSRFGFSPVWPDYQMSFEAATASHLESSLVLRDPIPRDIPQMAALYEQQWGGRVTVERSPVLWLWRIACACYQVLVAADDTGQVYGYIAGDDLLSAQVEVVAGSMDAAAALMAFAGQRHVTAEGHDSRVIVWPVPPDDSLITYARALMDVAAAARFNHSMGWMARVIDMGGLADALLPELYAQMTAVLPDERPASLVFDYDADGVIFGLHGRPASRVRLAYPDFIQVMFGSLAPEALGMRENLAEDAVLLLRALFPPRVTALGWWDWF